MSECVGANTRHPSGENVPRQSSSSLLRSRSSQSLRPSHDHVTAGPAADDRLTVLVQMFWISVSLLESDFEYEFLLAVRLLDKVAHWTSISLSVCVVIWTLNMSSSSQSGCLTRSLTGLLSLSLLSFIHGSDDFHSDDTFVQCCSSPTAFRQTQ